MIEQHNDAQDNATAKVGDAILQCRGSNGLTTHFVAGVVLFEPKLSGNVNVDVDYIVDVDVNVNVNVNITINVECNVHVNLNVNIKR